MKKRELKIFQIFSTGLLKKKINEYEIILVSNGSTDNTRELTLEYEKKYSFVKSLHINEKSRGKALKLAIEKSKYDLIAVCAIDNAWDLNFYLESYRLIEVGNYDVIFGPKTHKKSEVDRPIFRKIISFVSSNFLKILFGDIIDQDTQCIKIFNKKKIVFNTNLSDSNLFSDVEFFLFTKLFKLKYLSVPVRIKDNKGTVSIKMMFSFVLNAISFRFSKRYKEGLDIYNKD